MLYNIHTEGKINPSECKAPKNSKERYESLPNWTMQRDRGKKKEWGRLNISSRRLEIPSEHFMQK